MIWTPDFTPAPGSGNRLAPGARQTVEAHGGGPWSAGEENWWAALNVWLPLCPASGTGQGGYRSGRGRRQGVEAMGSRPLSPAAYLGPLPAAPSTAPDATGSTPRPCPPPLHRYPHLPSRGETGERGSRTPCRGSPPETDPARNADAPSWVVDDEKHPPDASLPPGGGGVARGRGLHRRGGLDVSLRPPLPRWLLLDAGPPRMSGLERWAAVPDRAPATPIVIC